MSYDTMRFGWQKLLVHNLPYKGRKYYPTASAPPPRDWSPEWNRVTAAGQTALKSLDEIGKIFSTGGGAAAFAARQAEVNAKIAEATTQIDQALALNSTIPASWFGDRLAERNSAIANLQQSKSNLSRYIGTWEPNKTDLINDEITRQTLLLSSQNRFFRGPAAPPASGAYPGGTWQYILWSKGYMPHELSWAESELATGGIPISRDDLRDYDYYTKIIEDAIQDAIIVGKIPAPEKVELVQTLPPGSGALPVLPPGPITYQPTGPIEGVGTYTGGPVTMIYDPVYGEDGVTYGNIMSVPKGIRWSRKPWVADGNKVMPDGDAQVGIGNYTGGPVTMEYDPVYGEDGNTYGNVMSVPKGVRWSRKPWVGAPINGEIRVPIKPIGINIGTPQYRTWLRRIQRNPVKGSPGRCGPIYGNQPIKGGGEWDSLWVTPRVPSGQADQPWCGTGIVTGQDWETRLIGEGCTVSHLDTIRRFFASAKLAPGSNQTEIAMTICTRLKNQDGLMPDVQVLTPIDIIGSAQTVPFAVAAPNNAITNIPGVVQQQIPPRAIAAQNLAARRQASRVRRGAFR